MATKFRRLHIPDDILAIGVLVANFHQRSGYSVNPLSVDVKPIPWVRELDDRVSFEGLLKEDALDGNP